MKLIIPPRKKQAARNYTKHDGLKELQRSWFSSKAPSRKKRDLLKSKVQKLAEAEYKPENEAPTFTRTFLPEGFFDE